MYLSDFQNSYIFGFRTLHIFKEANHLIFDKFDHKSPFFTLLPIYYMFHFHMLQRQSKSPGADRAARVQQTMMRHMYCLLLLLVVVLTVVLVVLVVLVGHRGSVVACVTYKREITGSIPGCSNIVLPGKALCPHVDSLGLGVSGYLVGRWRLVCLNSSVRRKWQPGCMLSRELRWLKWMNRSVTRG